MDKLSAKHGFLISQPRSGGERSVFRVELQSPGPWPVSACSTPPTTYHITPLTYPCTNTTHSCPHLLTTYTTYMHTDIPHVPTHIHSPHTTYMPHNAPTHTYPIYTYTFIPQLCTRTHTKHRCMRIHTHQKTPKNPQNSSAIKQEILPFEGQ